MSKASPFYPASNAGEFSPRMDARVDFEKYPAGVSRALNLLAMPQGGLTFRPGLRFVAEIGSSATTAALVPFRASDGSNYMLEFGSQTLRFYRNQGRLEAENIAASITNGTFTSNITGWTDRSTGSGAISHSSGAMALAGAADGYAWAEQSVTVSSGTSLTHVLRFTVGGAQGVGITVQIGTASKGGQIAIEDHYGRGTHTLAFVPGTSPVFVQFINKNNNTATIDDVSLLDNVPIEITVPYAASDARDLHYAQVNDLLYIFHGDYQPRKLERRGDASWGTAALDIEDGPWLEINPDIDLADGNLVTNPTFEGGIQDWTQVTSGDDAFVEYDGEQGVVFMKSAEATDTVEIRQQIATVASIKHVLHFQIVGSGHMEVSIGTTAGGTDILAATDYVPGWHSLEFTPSDATIHLTFERSVDYNNSVPGLGGVFLYNSRHNLLEPSARTGSVTLAALGDFKPFASTDVGRLVRLEWPGREPGWGFITAFTDSQTVTFRVVRELPATTPIETWRFGAFSSTTGYPHRGTFHGQRLLLARTESQPQTIWGSVAGDFENFRPDAFVEGASTVEDDNALNFTLGGTENSAIQWMIGGRRLIVGTASGQWQVASRGPALTPSDCNPEEQTFEAGANVAPVKAGNVILFVDKSTQAVYDLGYNYEVDGLAAADLNILADHIAGVSSFLQIVFQRKPFANLWARKTDGTLACLTYKREQNVVGWQDIHVAGSAAGNGVVESMAVIPGDSADDGQVYTSVGRDELWLLVRRTINGGTKRYIEVMEGPFRSPNRAEYESKSTWLAAVLAAQDDAVYLDSAITYDGTATATITGLSHLEGETVSVWGDGVKLGNETVSSGSITIDSSCSKVQVGLSYLWKFRSLKLPHGSPTGAGVGQSKTVNKLVLALLETGAYSYALDSDDGDLNFYDAANVLGSSNELFSGEREEEMEGGWSGDPRIWLKGESPYPFTLLGYGPKTVENEQ